MVLIYYENKVSFKVCTKCKPFQSLFALSQIVLKSIPLSTIVQYLIRPAVEEHYTDYEIFFILAKASKLVSITLFARRHSLFSILQTKH